MLGEIAGVGIHQSKSKKGQVRPCKKGQVRPCRFVKCAHRLTRAEKGYILLLLLKIPKSREGEAQGTCRHREPGALAETPGVGH